MINTVKTPEIASIQGIYVQKDKWGIQKNQDVECGDYLWFMHISTIYNLNFRLS